MISPQEEVAQPVPRFGQRVRKLLRPAAFIALGLLIVLELRSSSDGHRGWLNHTDASKDWKASRRDTRQLVGKILNNLELPTQADLSEATRANTTIEYWPYTPQDYTNAWAGYNYALALKSGWTNEDILQCVQNLGPHQRITFAGDSLMRAQYRQTLTERLGTDWEDMPQLWPLQQHDVSLSLQDSETASNGTEKNASLVTLSFRFLCNAHPHAESVLRDVLDSDVLVLNSGLWDLSVGKPVPDVSFVRDFMYSLSQLVAFLQANFRGRIIWRLNPTVWFDALEENRKQVFQDSKIRFLNIFAEKLLRGAGYEVLDAFSATAGNPALQQREDGYHVGRLLTDVLIDLTFNQICDPLGADFGPNTACEIIEAITKDGQQNAPIWNGWVLDLSVKDDSPQVQNLSLSHANCASNRPRGGSRAGSQSIQSDKSNRKIAGCLL